MNVRTVRQRDPLHAAPPITSAPPPSASESDASASVASRALGGDPGREGLRETPARVARAFTELTLGATARPDHLSRGFAQDHAGDDVVMLKGIRFVSLCEHHMLPFTGVAHVAYLPSHSRVAGLSKLARTVDVFARRLQMQERLTAQVTDALLEHLDPRGDGSEEVRTLRRSSIRCSRRRA